MKTLCFAAMLVSASALHISNIDDENCKCLRWPDAYTYYGKTCDGGEELCTGFFMHMNNNYCVAQNIGEGNAELEYCFVSAACPDHMLNGATLTFGRLKAKYCTDAEERIGAKTPEELNALADKDDLDRGLLMKLAYPTAKRNRMWPDIKPYFTQAKADWPVTVTEGALHKLEEIRMTGAPTVVDSHDGQPPFAVVWGNKAYEIAERETWPKRAEELVKSGASVYAHPSEMSTMTCLNC